MKATAVRGFGEPLAIKDRPDPGPGRQVGPRIVPDLGADR